MEFPGSYWESAEQFRAGAEAAGLRLESYPLAERGPQGEPLSLDVAGEWDTRSEKMLIISSGLHGVEGHLGAAVQHHFLQSWKRQRPQNIRLVLLHALNPHGFAWSRRNNEENVDPNRNFLNPGEQYSGAPAGYRLIDGLLNPRSHPGRRWRFYARSLVWIVLHGMAAMKQAVAEGQYEYPQGLFFGGKGPSQTCLWLKEHLPRWVGDARHVWHLDFHTGLGKWGTYRLLMEDNLPRKVLQPLEELFGRHVIEASRPEGVAYHSSGSIGQWCTRLFPTRPYRYFCAEFGTYAPLTVLAALRDENWAHHHQPQHSPCQNEMKARLREVFIPQSAQWRRHALETGIGLVEKALAYLTQLSAEPGERSHQ